MKKLKSLLAIILCLAMVLSFAGCGSETTVSDDGEWEITTNEDVSTTGGDSIGVTNSEVAQGNSAATAALAKNKEFLDSLKGLEINIYTQRTEKPTRGTATGDRYFAILDKVAKKYDVKINYISELLSDSALQTSILSGKPRANVIGIQDYKFADWLNAGVALNLNGAMNKTGISFTEKWYNQDARKFANFNNEQYAYVSDINEPYVVAYNKRMIQEAGLTAPIDLYEDGKWTFDKMTEYMKKLQKTSADGNVLVRGLSTISSVSTADYLIGMNGSDALKIESGKMVSNLNDPAVKNALSYAQKWYYIDKTAITHGIWYEAFETFATGKAAMVLGSKYTFTAMNEYNMTDAVGVVPFPYGPDASKDIDYTLSQMFLNIIPKCSEKEAHKILFIMDQINQEVYSYREQDFADEFRAILRDTNSYEIFKALSLGTMPTKVSYFGLSGAVYTGTQSLFNLTSSVSGATAVETAINTYGTSLSTQLNENWGAWKFTGK